MPPSLGDIDGMIERKLAAASVTIVGSPVGFGTMMPVPGLDNYAQPLDRLEVFHEWLFGLTERHSGHLLCYAYTNPFGDDALFQATKVWATHPGVVGLIANTSVCGSLPHGPPRPSASGRSSMRSTYPCSCTRRPPRSAPRRWSTHASSSRSAATTT